MKVYVLNSFAKTANGGNPAGICLDADKFSTKVMQRIASLVHLETAFVQKSTCADLKVRFFCHSGEVDLCGHDTIALFVLMAMQGIVKKGKYQMDTKAGILEIEVRDKGTVFMQQKLPVFSEVLTRGEVSKALRIPLKDAGVLQPQVVSTGVRDIIVEVKTLKTLLNMKPDFKDITGLSRKYNTIGLHAFSRQTIYSATAHCRNFAPRFGIPEESGTGTSNGALSCYLHKYGIIGSKPSNLRFEQGYSMKMPSEVLVNLTLVNGSIKKVQVGGTAIMKGVLEI
jgi:PhzF family phenazine biosynthesis protein